jgi:hypothetical protein
MFSSDRISRRYWVAAILISLSILAAVPLARPLQNWLTAQFSANIFKAISLLFVPIGIWILYNLVWKPGTQRITRFIYFLFVSALFARRLAALPVEVERFHLLEYGALALCVLLALYHRGSTRISFAWSLSACFLVGMMDEYYQFMTPGRYGEIRDILINCEGALLALLIPLYLGPFTALRKPSPRSAWAGFSAALAILALLCGMFILKVQIFGYRIIDTDFGIFSSVFTQDELLNMDPKTVELWASDHSNGSSIEPDQKRRDWYIREATEHFNLSRFLIEKSEMDSAMREFGIAKRYYGAYLSTAKLTLPRHIEAMFNHFVPPHMKVKYRSDALNFIITSVTADQIKILTGFLPLLFLAIAGTLFRKNRSIQ